MIRKVSDKEQFEKGGLFKCLYSKWKVTTINLIRRIKCSLAHSWWLMASGINLQFSVWSSMTFWFRKYIFLKGWRMFLRNQIFWLFFLLFSVLINEGRRPTKWNKAKVGIILEIQRGAKMQNSQRNTGWGILCIPSIYNSCFYCDINKYVRSVWQWDFFFFNFHLSSSFSLLLILTSWEYIFSFIIIHFKMNPTFGNLSCRVYHVHSKRLDSPLSLAHSQRQRHAKEFILKEKNSASTNYCFILKLT